jgi:hypothetical protein
MPDTLGENAKDTKETLGKANCVSNDVPQKDLTGKSEILSVLARAADEPEFISRLVENPDEALKEYYTLTQEQKIALASGDIQKIESWLGRLDKRLASWLLYHLGQDK